MASSSRGGRIVRPVRHVRSALVANPAAGRSGDPSIASSATLGVISDTHDLVRPEALAELRGSSLILHCGDLCSPEVITELERIAPVVAVRGNCDHGAWAETLPSQRTLSLFGWRIHMVHDLSDLAVDPEDGVEVVLFGHSHRPSFETDGPGPVYLNPGSAGPRRFHLPIAVARMRLDDDHFWWEQVEWEAP